MRPDIGSRLPWQVFHAWSFLSGRGRGESREEFHRKLEHIITFENSQGFLLKELIPLDGFVKNPDKMNPGTDAHFALFERTGDTIGSFMLDRWTMKEERPNQDNCVSCPVIGCNATVSSMTKKLSLDSPKSAIRDYRCPEHGIYISPTTFEYEEPNTSILWSDPDDLDALKVIESTPGGKRTWKRMGRERDEDSLTWNVFRYLQNHNLLGNLNTSLASGDNYSSESVEKCIYWSVDIETKSVWDKLLDARLEIGESEEMGSEPDIILVGEYTLTFVETKFTSGAKTPVKTIPSYYDDYLAKSAQNLFKGTFVDAVDEMGYELARFFILGHCLAQKLGNRRFKLILLTMEGADSDMTARTGRALGNIDPETFIHATWNDMKKYILSSHNRPQEEADRLIVKRYLAGKTAGYKGGKLVTLIV